MFKIADKDPGVNNFPYFEAFWIDGKKLRSLSEYPTDADYEADPGSTVVTVYAKTFQDLDNGEHTIAAEFMIPNPESTP